MKKIYGYIFAFVISLFLFGYGVKADVDSVTCDYGDFKLTYNKVENKVTYDYNSNEVAITDIRTYINNSDYNKLFVSGNTLTCPSLKCSSSYNNYLGWTSYSIDEKASTNACPLKDKHLNDSTNSKDEKIICNYGVFIVTYHKANDSYTFSNYNSKTQDISDVKKYLMTKTNLKSKFINSNGELYCPTVKCYKKTVNDASGGTNTQISKYIQFTGNGHTDFCQLNGSGDNSSDMGVDTSNTTENTTNNTNTGTIVFPSFDFGELGQSCEEFLGATGVKLIKTARKIIQIGSTILTLVLGMIMFIPAIMNKDNAALSKALSKFVKLLIVLAIILLLPTLVKVIGMIAGFDISCI